MKQEKTKFLINSLLLLTLLCIVFGSINYYYIRVIERDKQVFRSEAEWQEFKRLLPDKTLDYAFFGDSHARCGFNPRYISNSFNFASDAGDYIETYYKIKKLIEHDTVTIKNIILEIDTHTFSDKLRTDENLFSELHYYSSFIDLKEISQLKNESVLSLYVKNKIPILGKGNEIIRYIISPPELTEIENGWVHTKKDFSKQDKALRAFKKYNLHFKNSPDLLVNKSIVYFKKVLTMARDNNINVIFIKYPVSFEYDKELKKHYISRTDYYGKLMKIIDNTITDYIILDYYDIFFDKPEYLSDSDHLNYKGSNLLSGKIAEDLKRMQHKTQ